MCRLPGGVATRAQLRALLDTYGVDRTARYLATAPQILLLKDHQVHDDIQFLSWFLGKPLAFKAVDGAPEVRTALGVEADPRESAGSTLRLPLEMRLFISYTGKHLL